MSTSRDNPFSEQSELNLPLGREICQRIHYAALRGAGRNCRPEEVPESVPLAQIRQLARLHGPSAHFVSQMDIDRIFSGVTLAAYRTIDSLYCARIGRSMRMVWQMLGAMASQEGAEEIDYEAVWAICTYLQDRRTTSLETTVEHTGATWQMVVLSPRVSIEAREGSAYQPSVVCVLDTHSSDVLAFRLTNNEDMEETISLVLYDAIVSQRQPSPEGNAGLTWSIPSRVVTALDISKDCQCACRQLGIRTKQTSSTALSQPDLLHSNWDQDLAGRVFRPGHFTMLFDNYLKKIRGHGPLRERERRSREYRHSIGYGREPTWQFPALRSLLPSHSGVIAPDGTAECDGLHYESELLTYWPDREVTLRRSEDAEVLAWIYLDDEILCQAMARELRRWDGTYRPNRPRR